MKIRKILVATLVSSALLACGTKQKSSETSNANVVASDIDYSLSDAPTPMQGDTGSCYMWALQALLSHRANPAERADASRIDFASTFYFDWWEMQDADVEKALDLEALNYTAMKKEQASESYQAMNEADRKSHLMWGVFPAREGLLGGLLLGQDSYSSDAFESMRKRVVLKSSDFVSDQVALKELQDITARFVESRWNLALEPTTLTDVQVKDAMKSDIYTLAKKIAELQAKHGSDELPSTLAKLKFNKVNTKEMTVAQRREVFLQSLRDYGALASEADNHQTVIVGYHAASDEFDVRDSETEERYYSIKGDKFFETLDSFEYMAE